MGFTDPNYWKQSLPPQTGDMNNERYLNQKAVLELPGAQIPQELTIADGSISPTRAAVVVDTEGGGVADDLEAISPVISATENLHNGMLITLRAKDPARAVTVKNSAAANGINTADGNDIVLSPDWELTLRLVGGRWYEVQSRSGAQAAEAQEDASTALGRTDPATTASRGIARVATLAELGPDAVVEDGPAFLAAGVHTSVAAAAGKVPVADSNGTIDAWLMRAAPPGFSGFYAGKTPPDGWLEETGAAISRTIYSRLFAAIGTTYGVGDGTTTFNIPDSRGYAKRVWDNGKGIDSGRVLGSTQQDSIKSHSHSLGYGYNNIQTSGNPNTNDVGKTEGGTSSGYSTAAFGGTETVMKNIAFMGIIKY